ncbi:MAG: hypothetical protein IPL74_11905 [Bacteroidetes bacterium]|nr:hypothetical protein [Bacteroidota bacterium]
MTGFKKIGGGGVDTYSNYRSGTSKYALPLQLSFGSFLLPTLSLIVKEEWFFDKQRSVIDVRIIGIAPLILCLSMIRKSP